jgi:uncharacterized protein (DUF849 family)
MTEPVILEVALNGLTASEKNRHVPRAAEALRNDAGACLAAGAAILHAHSPDMRATGDAAAREYLAAAVTSTSASRSSTPRTASARTSK